MFYFKHNWVTLFLLINLYNVSGCTDEISSNSSSPETFRIMFYNTENFFDTFNDTTKLDDSFTPEGDKHWTYKKYITKYQNIYKIITAVGGWEPPAIIGLCEVENREVLYDLCNNTPLSKYDYKIIHYDSPDSRGIDVAMLYKDNIFRVLHSERITVTFPKNPQMTTRDILYVCGIINNTDTLHVFVNHWPSRRQGEDISEHNRFTTAQLLRSKTDSLLHLNNNAKIICMGDFNDEPGNTSIKDTLNNKNKLVNLSYNEYNSGNGTYKYQGQWFLFDQIIASQAMLNDTTSLHTERNAFKIYSSDFITEEDIQYTGRKLFKTYSGMIYTGGYSDHLPIYIDIYY